MPPQFPVEYFDFPHTIWRIFPDTTTNRVAVETRDQSTKVAAGFSLHPGLKQIIPIAPLPSWWSNLVSARDGIALWTGFQEEGIPVSKGIYAFSLPNGSPAWQHPDKRFVRIAPEVALAIQPETPGQTFFLDWQTGEIREIVPTDHLPADWLDQYEELFFGTFSFPETFLPDDRAYQNIVQQNDFPVQPQGPVSRLRAGGNDIFHLYHNGGQEGHQASVVIMQSGKLLEGPLPAGAFPRGFGHQLMLMTNEWLLWVCPPNQIGAINLSALPD